MIINIGREPTVAYLIFHTNLIDMYNANNISCNIKNKWYKGTPGQLSSSILLFFLFCKFWTLVEWSLKVEQPHVPQNNLQLSLLTFRQSEHLLMIYLDCKQRPRFLSLASLLTNIFLNMFFLIIS